MGEAYRGFWWGSLKERASRETGLDGRIILRRNFNKWDYGVWRESSWLRIRTVGGHL